MKYNNFKFALESLISDIEEHKSYRDKGYLEKMHNKYWFISGEISVLVSLEIISVHQGLSIIDNLYKKPDISINIISNILEDFNAIKD